MERSLNQNYYWNVEKYICRIMKFKRFFRIHPVVPGVLALILGTGSINAQPTPPPFPVGSPIPPPQNPIASTPNSPISPGPAPISPAPPPGAQTPPPPGWGGPGYLSSPPAGEWMNQGYLNVMATGYDSESVLVQIPLYVSYSFNGANYDVTVINSWNPYTQTWNVGVDSPAYQTDYYFNGFNYNYYAVLPSGTYYFNL